MEEENGKGFVLGYWAIRGRGGACRLALELAGVKGYEEVRYTMDE